MKLYRQDEDDTLLTPFQSCSSVCIAVAHYRPLLLHLLLCIRVCLTGNFFPTEQQLDILQFGGLSVGIVWLERKMLGGVKFLARDEIDKANGEESNDSRKERHKSISKREKKHRHKKKSSHYRSSNDEEHEKIKKRSRKKWYSSDEDLSSCSTESQSEDNAHEAEKKQKGKRMKRRDVGGSEEDEVNIVRREMGLEWMLKPADRIDRNVNLTYEEQFQEQPTEEIRRTNPKELNPYLRDDGSGYPEDSDQVTTSGRDKLLSTSLVGDGGASWRLKALKRTEEQAAREGRSLDEVAKERWGSLGHLAVSVASQSAAPSHAHLHAIKSRKMVRTDNQISDQNKQGTEKQSTGREYLKDATLRHPEMKMKAPKVRESLSWGKKKGQSKDAALIKNVVSRLNKFSDDGSFMNQFGSQQNEKIGLNDALDSKAVGDKASDMDLSEKKGVEEKQPLSANQLAAKVLQLRMRGKHEEADKLSKDAEVSKVEHEVRDTSTRHVNQGNSSRYVTQDIKRQKRKEEENSDIILAQTIMKNKQYNLSGGADDEYDYDDGPSRKGRKKGANVENQLAGKQILAKRIITQQERCQFCFENPNRPRHLVIAIANFTYLMLPLQRPVVPGHCCILPMHHESATRTVDDNVWEEIRNFKKCLIMMFAKQEKEMIFLETVIGLAQQRRHCLIECIPLPKEISKEAPLYFKKAIDEAESEWSQHNAKRLIDISEKGLRGSIPKNFPYFLVEFGLNRGFVHVIDDEQQFKGCVGLNVIRGMMQLPEEDMYRRRRYDTAEAQKQAVANFARDWEPFDWTKQLDS